MKLFYILGIYLVMLSFVSCIKPVTYPNEPEIKFESFVTSTDTGFISISFTDGDGDIGLNEADTTGDFSPSSFYHYNLYLEYYEKMNGVWVKGRNDPGGNNFPTADTINFGFRIQNLTPTGKNKALKGLINIALEPFYYNPLSNYNDTIKYAITLIDRSLNISNRIETPEYVR